MKVNRKRECVSGLLPDSGSVGESCWGNREVKFKGLNTVDSGEVKRGTGGSSLARLGNKAFRDTAN